MSAASNGPRKEELHLNLSRNTILATAAVLAMGGSATAFAFAFTRTVKVDGDQTYVAEMAAKEAVGLEKDGAQPTSNNPGIEQYRGGYGYARGGYGRG